VLSLSVAALAQVPGDENGTDQVETTEAAKTNWLERNGITIGAVAALLAIIAYLSGLVSRIKKITLAKLGKKPPESTSPPQQISTENRTTTASGERSKAIGGDVSSSIIADTITLTPEALESLHPKSTEPPGKISNIPHPHNPNFTGRVDLLDSLHEALTSGQYVAFTQTQAITGLGGVGKTQLALEYTYRHLADYEIVWWVKSEEPATLAADYASLAAKLDLPEKTSPDQNAIIGVVKSWLEQNVGWLMVFDNVQDPEDLEDYLPHTGGGHVIVTSRNPNWGGIVRTLPVDVFSRAESIEFLRNRTGQDDGADALTDALGNLPLALEQAGAYIEETRITLSNYLKRFQEQQKEVLERGKPVSYPATVTTTWEMSFKQVQEASDTGADLLNLCAFLAPDDIPKSLLVGGARHLPPSLAPIVADDLEFDEAVAVLMRYSLITGSSDNLSIHRLVQAVTRDRLEEDDRKRWSEAAVQLVDYAFPRDSDDFHNWPVCSLLLPHALATAGHAEELGVVPETTGDLLNRIGIYLNLRAEYKDSKSVLESALVIFENVYGPDHPEVARTLTNLGIVLRQLGDYEGAKERLERSLVIFENVYGPDHPMVARTLTNLGTVLKHLEDYEGAKERQERSLVIFENVYGPDHPMVARTLTNLGTVLENLGNYKGAKERLERSLVIFENVYGPDHPEVAGTLGNLGIVLRQLGDYEGAKERLERSLVIFENVYGSDHPEVAITLGNLGIVLRQLGDYEGAKEHYERALEIDEKAYGPDHPNVAIRVNNLGSVLKAQGDLEGAKKLFERALEIDEKAYGPDHPNVAIRVNNLGSVLKAQGDLEGAKKLFERALGIFRDKLGEDHPYTKTTRGNLEALQHR